MQLANVHQRVLTDLHWERVRSRALAHCQSEVGARLLGEDRFLADRAAIEHELRLVSELKGIVDIEDAPPPLRGLADLEQVLQRTERQGVLEGEELIAVADTLSATHHTRQMVARNEARAPDLSALFEDLPPGQDLFEELYDTFEPSGRVRDDASPRLRELRQRIASLHERLRKQVVDEMRRHDENALLQDDFFTMREERYVLPVKAQFRSAVSGIVHGNSNTGQTVYIEPESLITTNNQLKVAEQEAERECWLIRKRASELVALAAADIRQTVLLGARLDSLAARALLSRELDLAAPEITDGGPLVLRRSRNPLLLLQGTEVVPNDIVLGDGFHILVVTGPNTGGKTVTLSTIGLSVLMAAAGYHVPAAADSRVPVYESLHTAMSDAQSFERGLSAFSGHVRLLTRILARASAQSLVLLDEVMVGTEPSQGSALAAAFLERFADAGVTVAVTTHYDRLKTLSYADSRFRNASVGLDTEHLTPNFRLTTGLPGASSPIAIAARLGIDPDLIERARTLVGEEALSLDRVVRELEAERTALEAERRGLAEARRQAERTREASERALQELKRDGQRLARERFDEALALARKFRKELEDMRRKVRAGGVTPAEVQASRKRVDAIEKEARAAQPKDPDAPPPLVRRKLRADELVAGRDVWVATFNRLGQIEKPPADLRRVPVVMGVMRTTVAADALYAPAAEDRKGARRASDAPRAGGMSSRGALPSIDYDSMSPPAKVPDNTCDVRGMYRDEAVEELERCLDTAASRSGLAIWVVHGHGSGVLKEAVREHLAASPYVTHFRPAERSEGGDGVTLAWLE